MKKVMLTMFASIMLVFVGIISVACCGDNDPTKVESFAVNGLTTSYVNTDTVNLSGISLEVTYDNNQKETLTKYEIDPSEGIELKEDTQFILYTDGLSSQQAGNININDYAITAKVVGFDDILRLGTVSVTLASATEITEYEVSGMETEYFNTNTVDFTGTQLSVTYNNFQTVLLSKFEIDKDINEVAEDTQFVIYTDGLSTQPAGDLEIRDYNITAKVVGFDETLSLGTISVKLATAEDITEHKVSGLKTTYVNTDTVTFEGISLKVTYGNHESEVLTKYEIDKDINEVTEGTQFVIYTSGLSTQPAGNIEDKSYNITAKVVGFENQELNLGTVVVTIAEPTEIVSHEVVYMPTSFYETDTVDFVGTKLRVTFDNHQTLILTKFELDKDLSDIKADTEFVLYTDGLSSQTAGNLEIKDYNITAKVVGFNKTLALGTIKVESDWNRYEVDTFLVPESIDTYNEIVENNVSTEEAGFYNVEAMYTIGDDNGFKFKPQLILVPKDSSDITEDYEPETYNVNVKVFMDDNDTALADDSTYYTFDNFEFDFTETAIGHTFKIEMSLSDYPTTLPISFTFKVADGWNAYTPDDLGRINILDFDNSGYARRLSQKIFYNSDTQKYDKTLEFADIWEDYLTEKGYTDLTAINGIYIHNNILVSDDDLPEEYFITEEESAYAAGSLRDFSLLYSHYLEEGQDFIINGNYFSVKFGKVLGDNKEVLSEGVSLGLSNSSKDNFSVYTADQAKYSVGHSAVFNFMGKTDNTTTSVGRIVNLNAQGNTGGVISGGNAYDPTGETDGLPTTPDDATKEVLKLSGSLIFTKSMHARVEVENAIAKEFLIAWFGEQKVSDTTVEENKDKGNLKLTNVKTYDCFSSAIFAYASDNNEIINSEFKRFGGPVVMLVSQIAKNIDTDEEIGGTEIERDSSFKVDEATVMENYIAGDEAWFILNFATAVATSVKDLEDGLLAKIYNSIYFDIPNKDGVGTTEKANLLVLALDSGYMNSNEDTHASYMFTENSSDKNFSTDSEDVRSALDKGYTVIKSSGGELITLDGKNPTSQLKPLNGEHLMLSLPLGATQVMAVYELQSTLPTA